MDSKRWKIVAAEDMFINTLISNIPECPFPVRITSISAISAQYDVSTIRIIAGLAGTFISENLKGGTAPSDRFRLSPVAGLSWNFHKNIHLRACFKEGFRVPTFNDLYYARVGNVNLKPEIARQVNLGLTFSGTYGWGTADITADGYYNFVKDKIIAVPTMFIWKMRNVGEVEMYGADLTASAGLDLCKWLRINISGNYSLQYALDITDPESKNYRHQIPYAPRHTANGYIIFETDWFNISYRLNFCGKRYVKSQNITSNEIKPYADHSITLNRSFEFGKRHSYRIALSLEGLNLSDNNYEIINYYPMPGRSYRLTIKFRY